MFGCSRFSSRKNVGGCLGPESQTVSDVGADPFERGRAVVDRVEGRHIEIEVDGEATEQVVSGDLLFAPPMGLGGEHALVHLLEPPLLGGGFDRASSTFGVEVSGHRKVADDERNAVAVGSPQILDDRVDGSAGFALEVQELDELRPALRRRRQPMTVGPGHQIRHRGGIGRGAGVEVS